MRAVLGGAEPDERTRALVALLYASHSLTAVFPRLEARPMKRRAREIARRSWEDEGLAMALAEYFSYMAQLSAATMV